MNSEWKQYVYGKFTVSPEGAILPGKDYQCTGCSSGIPMLVKESMRPTIVGPGVSDMTDWNEYLWNDEGGGYAIQAVLNDGSPWMVAGRVRGRSESGEDAHGRMYVQGHYITQDVQHYSPLSLKGITGVLYANPMQEMDEDLPLLSVDSADQPLMEGWLEKISVMLVGLMSGVPIGIKSTKLPLEKFFTLFQTISCAVPSALSWRLSMNIGAMKVKEGVVVLAQGSSVMGGARLLGYKWDVPPASIEKIKGLDSAIRHPRARGFIGERYVQFLQEEATEAKTLQELQQIVQEKFPNYGSWNSKPHTETFQQLAVAVVESLIERDALAELDQALAGTGELPLAKWFNLYQQHALKKCFPYALTTGSPFLVDVLRDIENWKDAWHSVTTSLSEDSDIVTLALLYRSLFTTLDHLSKENLSQLLGMEIPSILQTYVLESLDQQLIADFLKENSSAAWSLLYSAEKAAWLVDWVQSKKMDLFWMSMRHRRMNSDSLYQAGLHDAPWTYIARLQAGESLSQEEGEAWMEGLPDVDGKLEDLSAVIETVMEKNIVSGIEMMGWSDAELPLKVTLMSDQVYSWSSGETAVLDIVERLNNGMELQEITARIAFAFAYTLSAENKVVLVNAVKGELSSHIGFPLLGGETGKKGKWDRLADEVFLYQYSHHRDFGKDVIEESFAGLQGEDRDSFRKYILTYLSVKENQARCKYGEVIMALIHEWNAAKISEDMVDILSWLMAGGKLRNPTQWIHDAAGLRALILAGYRKLELTSELLNCLLTAEQSSFDAWQKIIVEQEWEKKDGWRILSRLGQDPTSVLSPEKAEAKAIAQQQPLRLLEFVNVGILLSIEGYQQIIRAFPVEQVLKILADAVNSEDEQIRQQAILWSNRNIYIGLAVALYSEDKSFIQYQATLALRVLNAPEVEEKLYQEYGQAKSFFGSMWSKVEQNVGQLSRMVLAGIDAGEDLVSLLNTVFSSLEEDDNIAFFEAYRRTE